MLNTALPTIVPTPMSPSVINVPMTFTNSSGADVAAAMNVAPATSFDILRAENKRYWNLNKIVGYNNLKDLYKLCVLEIFFIYNDCLRLYNEHLPCVGGYFK